MLWKQTTVLCQKTEWSHEGTATLFTFLLAEMWRFFFFHTSKKSICLWKCNLAAGAQNPKLSYTSVASAAVVKFRARRAEALTYTWLLRVKEPKRSWWPESSCHAARWTWRRSAPSTRPTSGSRCKRLSRWITQHQEFITRFVLSSSLAHLLCLCRSTLRETTRRRCSACADQRNKWSPSSVSEGPHFPPMEGCNRKVGFWKIILAPNSVAKARPSFFLHNTCECNIQRD